MSVGSSQGVRAGRAFVEILAVDKTEKALLASKKRFEDWGKSVSNVGRDFLTLGAKITAPLLGAVSMFTRAGSVLDDLSKRTGASVEFLSALGFAATQTGTDIRQLEASLKHMQVALGQSGDLAGFSPEEQFLSIADAISKLPHATDRAAAAVKFFGRQGTELLPMMENGAEGVQQLMDKAKELRLVMGADTARSAAEFAQTMNHLFSVLKRGPAIIAGALIPSLRQFTATIIPILHQVFDWIQANSGLVVSLFQIGLAATAIGATLLVAGKALSLISVAATVATGVVKLLTASVMLLSSSWGLVLAPIAAGIAGLLAFTDVIGIAKEAWNGIVEAIMMGRLDLAFNVMWAGVKAIWAESTAFILNIWDNFIHNAVTAVTWLQTRVGEIFLNVMNFVGSVVGNAGYYVAQGFLQIVEWIATGTTKVINGILNVAKSVGDFLGISTDQIDEWVSRLDELPEKIKARREEIRANQEKFNEDSDAANRMAIDDLYKREDRLNRERRQALREAEDARNQKVNEARQGLRDAIAELDAARAKSEDKIRSERRKIGVPDFGTGSKQALAAIQGLEKGSLDAAKAIIEGQSQPFNAMIREQQQANRTLEQIDQGIQGINNLEFETVG